MSGQETAALEWTLGYDLGTQGAATLLDPAGVFAVWVWRDRQRGGLRCFELVLVTRDSGWEAVKQMVPTLGAVGQLIATQVVKTTGRTRLRVWAEEAHIGRNPKTGIQLGWNSGAVVGPMERFANDRKVEQVQASKWRHALLGLPVRTKRDQAKAASLKYMPPRLVGLKEALNAVHKAMSTPITKLDHITDSAGVAEYGWRYGDKAA